MKWRKFYSTRLLRTKEREAEEWAVSLADMMTLVLTFFVVLVSISSLNAKKYRDVAESMAKAMGSRERQVEVISTEGIKQALELMVSAQNLQGEVAVKSAQGGIDIVIAGGILFDLGSAQLKPEAKNLLERVAAQLKTLPYAISVEGHTDNIPINSPSYPSNWELSAARSSEVVRFFIDKGIPKSRLKAVGLADTRPLAPNLTHDGRPIPQNQAKNRRVVIVVTPQA